MLRRGVGAVLDAVFPLRCAGCRGPGSWFCASCAARLRAPRAFRCLACGRFSTVTPCPLCPASARGADTLVALAHLQGPGREALHRLKYGDRPQVADALVESLLERRGDLPPHIQAVLDAPAHVLAVPLHPSRLSSRGYNQAEELALALSERLGRRYCDGLARLDASPSLVGRSGEERRGLLEGAFTWRGPGPPPPRVLLVDDVATTGSTLQACARVLREAGAVCVNAVAVMQG
jgi:ComF family protein